MRRLNGTTVTAVVLIQIAARTPGFAADVVPLTTRGRRTINVVRAGVSYKFNP